MNAHSLVEPIVSRSSSWELAREIVLPIDEEDSKEGLREGDN